MASIPCSIQLLIPPTSSSSSSTNSSSSSSNKLRSPFLAARRRLGWFGGTGWPRRCAAAAAEEGAGPRAGSGSGTGGSTPRARGSTGASPGTISTATMWSRTIAQYSFEGAHNIIGDKPKIEELLRAGAKYDVKDADGRTALDRVANDEIKELILGFSVRKV
uniref:Protein LHCP TRANSLOCATION DEFECT n=1 Tax=Ananas comosus var. bracteatus TaxID=296719 RepID=A0A6V7NLC0_ANACO|nr:unnamed protein product [Ananas comosus var. bracteatus]